MKPAIPQTALVTGAAHRLGRAIAMDLAHHGFAVALHARNSINEAETLANEIRQKGGTALAIAADLSRIDETFSLVQKAADALGPIGLLVNNASVFIKDSPQHFDAQAFEDHFAIHVRAPSILAAEMARHLPDDLGGLIVNMIDQRVLAPTPRYYSYALSKSALWAATRTLAQGLAPRIRVNAIGPGPALRNDRQSEEDFQTQIDALILKRGPALEEFGRTIRFLFDTPSITGQMIALDGGQHLAWETPDVAEINE